MVIPIIRDTSLSSVGDEKDGNNGGAKRLKLKGIQEFALIDIDPTPLRGKQITGALLHLRSSSPKDAPLGRVGVSTLSTEWIEGNSSNYGIQEGSSSFNQARHQKEDWAYPGSTLMDVVFGHGHSLWRFADCSQPDSEGWQACAVEPDVIAARAAGLSYGFALSDEVGNTWSNRNGKFTYSFFPNRLFYSREQKESSPWLEVWTDGEDHTPPDPVQSVKVDNANLPAGEAMVHWKSPTDHGGGRTLGFLVSYIKGNEERRVPRHLIPMAENAGGEVIMHLRDLSLEPGETLWLTIRPVDNAGNIGKPFTGKVVISAGERFPGLPPIDLQSFSAEKGLPEVGGLKIAVVDLVDKIDPANGRMIPARAEGYKGGNHIFCGGKRVVRLQSARNETIAFQLNLEGVVPKVNVQFMFDQNQKLKPKIFQFAYVVAPSSKGKEKVFLPDPLLEVTGPVSIPSTGGQVRVPNQQNLSLICEVYVPHEEPPGRKKGKVTISVGKERLDLEVDLTVWNFTLPNKLSFIPEMNAYGMNPLYDKPEYYRLAHEHRTCLNWLSYGWHGLPFFAPKWNGDRFEWSDWERKVGPLLDGAAFKDLPRKNEPVDVFYLPFSENWPVSVFENFKPSYWADEAFTDQYRDELTKAFSAFARYCNQKNWHRTIFQFYLNNKVYNRKTFPRSSAPWIFDEPVNTQDFWALRWYGKLWRSAADPVQGKAKMWYRGDISYTQFGRNILWGVTDIEYLGSNDPQKMRMKRDEQTYSGNSHFAEYGTANKIETSNMQAILWCISAWSKGAMGILPWQTIGSSASWEKAEETALFYPHHGGPKPSVRLKAFTKGQQLVEYLTLLSQVYRKPSHTVVEWLRKTINLEGKVDKRGEGDAGTLKFEGDHPVDLWEIRYRIGKALSGKGLEYKRALIEWEKPERNTAKSPDIGYVSVGPDVERYRPDCDTFTPKN